MAVGVLFFYLQFPLRRYIVKESYTTAYPSDISPERLKEIMEKWEKEGWYVIDRRSIIIVLLEREVTEPRAVENCMAPAHGWWECHCQCHSNPHVHHCMNCCLECPECGLNISGDLEAHRKEVHGDPPAEVPTAENPELHRYGNDLLDEINERARWLKGD